MFTFSTLYDDGNQEGEGGEANRHPTVENPIVASDWLCQKASDSCWLREKTLVRLGFFSPIFQLRWRSILGYHTLGIYDSATLAICLRHHVTCALLRFSFG